MEPSRRYARRKLSFTGFIKDDIQVLAFMDEDDCRGAYNEQFLVLMGKLTPDRVTRHDLNAVIARHFEEQFTHLVGTTCACSLGKGK